MKITPFFTQTTRSFIVGSFVLGSLLTSTGLVLGQVAMDQDMKKKGQESASNTRHTKKGKNHGAHGVGALGHHLGNPKKGAVHRPLSAHVSRSRHHAKLKKVRAAQLKKQATHELVSIQSFSTVSTPPAASLSPHEQAVLNQTVKDLKHQLDSQKSKFGAVMSSILADRKAILADAKAALVIAQERANKDPRATQAMKAAFIQKVRAEVAKAETALIKVEQEANTLNKRNNLDNQGYGLEISHVTTYQKAREAKANLDSNERQMAGNLSQKMSELTQTRLQAQAAQKLAREGAIIPPLSPQLQQQVTDAQAILHALQQKNAALSHSAFLQMAAIDTKVSQALRDAKLLTKPGRGVVTPENQKLLAEVSALHKQVIGANASTQNLLKMTISANKTGEVPHLTAQLHSVATKDELNQAVNQVNALQQKDAAVYSSILSQIQQLTAKASQAQSKAAQITPQGPLVRFFPTPDRKTKSGVPVTPTQPGTGTQVGTGIQPGTGTQVATGIQSGTGTQPGTATSPTAPTPNLYRADARILQSFRHYHPTRVTDGGVNLTVIGVRLPEFYTRLDEMGR